MNESDMFDEPAPLYVVSDIHGHRDQLREVLIDAGLADAAMQWTGGRARLWFLGDYVDRGPDGIGVIDDVRSLASSAAASGGTVGVLVGNHEAQLLAAYRFGSERVVGLGVIDDFRAGWALFGGRDHDLGRLTDDHVAWIESLDAIALVGDHLLLHSDTDRYLDFGDSIDAVNAGVRAALCSTDILGWVEFTDRICDRGRFRDAEPARAGDAVSTMLATFGGRAIVHGHSTLTKEFGMAPAEVSPLRYAADRVTAVDGGIYEGGRLLLTRLV